MEWRVYRVVEEEVRRRNSKVDGPENENIVAFQS